MAAALQPRSEQIISWVNCLLDEKDGKSSFRGKPIDLRLFLLLIIDPSTNHSLLSHEIEKIMIYLDESRELDEWEISEIIDHKGVNMLLNPLLREIVNGNKESQIDHPASPSWTIHQITHPTLQTLSKEQQRHLIWVLEYQENFQIRDLNSITGSMMSLFSSMSMGSMKSTPQGI